MKPSHLTVVPTAPKPRKPKPVRDYRAWLKSKGVKIHRFEPTEKRAGEYELVRGELVACRGGG